MDWLESFLIPVNREGYRVIAAAALVTLVLFYVIGALGWLALAATLACVYAFRDPERVTPVRAGLVVSPADGIVRAIATALPPDELEMGPHKLARLSISVGPFDVHVTRIPVDGTVVRVAGENVARLAVRLAMSDGGEVAVVRIAGRLARRIVCNLAEGQRVKAGERDGMIRPGSRVDVYLAEGLAPQVMVGQRTVAGETVLADARSGAPQAQGAVR